MPSNVTIFKYIRLHIPTGRCDECQWPSQYVLDHEPIDSIKINFEKTKEEFFDMLIDWNRWATLGVEKREWFYGPIE